MTLRTDPAAPSAAAPTAASTGEPKAATMALGASAAALSAAAAAAVRIELLDDVAHQRDAADVIDQVWQMDEGHRLLEPNLLRALAHSGNYVAGAFAGAQLIGACVGFLGRDGNGSQLLHSHVAGVLPGGAGRGVGRAMKLHQRAWCLQREVQTIAWTYDPLIARNAYLNLRVLGASAEEYLVAFYGQMADAINAGDRTDRLLVRWHLTAPVPDPPEVGIDRAVPAAIYRDAAGAPVAAATPDASRCRLAIPADIEALRRSEPELATRWRMVVGEVLPALLATGWAVTGFDRAGHYLLDRAPAAPPGRS
ncbi:hypothetical protein [Nakamurella lactea]|uniref:hypothetical protein n=1 Tax=Nakamurella lactea TaxID=459515 RepID=UPI00041B3D47|nr:hypothetical protein [Nakamurella lactea]